MDDEPEECDKTGNINQAKNKHIVQVTTSSQTYSMHVYTYVETTFYTLGYCPQDEIRKKNINSEKYGKLTLAKSVNLFGLAVGQTRPNLMFLLSDQLFQSSPVADILLSKYYHQSRRIQAQHAPLFEKIGQSWEFGSRRRSRLKTNFLPLNYNKPSYLSTLFDALAFNHGNGLPLLWFLCVKQASAHLHWYYWHTIWAFVWFPQHISGRFVPRQKCKISPWYEKLHGKVYPPDRNE